MAGEALCSCVIYEVTEGVATSSKSQLMGSQVLNSQKIGVTQSLVFTQAQSDTRLTTSVCLGFYHGWPTSSPEQEAIALTLNHYHFIYLYIYYPYYYPCGSVPTYKDKQVSTMHLWADRNLKNHKGYILIFTLEKFPKKVLSPWLKTKHAIKIHASTLYKTSNMT